MTTTTLEKYRRARRILEEGRVYLYTGDYSETAISNLDKLVEHEWNVVRFKKDLTKEKVIQELADLYMTLRTHFSLRLNTTVSLLNTTCEELFLKKNADYGDAYAKLGPLGVVVAVYNKLKRLQVLQKKSAQIVTESIEDTMVDMLNYCILTVCTLQS